MFHHIENHIETMRDKPHHIKKQYAFFVSLVITLIIFGFWMISFRVQTVATANSGVNAPSPISSMTASVGDAFKGIGGVFIYAKELFFGMNKTTYSSDNVEVTGGK